MMHPFDLNKHTDIKNFYLKDVVRLQGSSNYTIIYFSNRKKLITTKVLHIYETFLASKGFIRIHKTHLVNVHCISKIDALGNIFLNDGSIITIARRRRKEVLLQLKEICSKMIIAA